MPFKCDFCSSPDVRWSYPAHSFIVDDPPQHPQVQWVNQSLGGWAACETCHALVEENNYSRLSRHSMALLLADHPEMAEAQEEIERHLRRLHKQFRKSRCGAATPVEIAKGSG